EGRGYGPIHRPDEARRADLAAARALPRGRARGERRRGRAGLRRGRRLSSRDLGGDLPLDGGDVPLEPLRRAVHLRERTLLPRPRGGELALANRELLLLARQLGLAGGDRVALAGHA